jgi:hypothetical protein
MLDDIKHLMANYSRDYMIPDTNIGGNNLNPRENRKIGNKAIINSLPSNGVSVAILSANSIIARGIPNPNDLSNDTDDVSLTAYYTLTRFLTANAKTPRLAAGHEHFFRNEVEYVIVGNYDDGENYSSVIDHLKELRLALNKNTLMTDSDMIKKVNSVCQMVESLVPADPWAPFIRDLVIAAWCAIETNNDIELIESGGKVPIYKKSNNWATNSVGISTAIEISALSGHSPGNINGIIVQALYESRNNHAVKPITTEGFNYIDYLRLYLYYTPKDVKLLRIMDLIQLNMKISYYADFLIREHYTGFRYQVVMNKDTYSYEQKYRK